jgi:hypothetical protein
MKPLRAILAILAITLSSCANPLTNQQKVLIGEWRAYDGWVKLVIEADGSFYMKQFPGTCYYEMYKYWGDCDSKGYIRGTWEASIHNCMLVIFYFDGKEVYLMRNGADVLYKEKSSLMFYRYKGLDK